jgi:hypothetical protein
MPANAIISVVLDAQPTNQTWLRNWRTVWRTPTLEKVHIGAGIGFVLGLITSYFVYKEVAADRETSTRQTEIYFGDLPPSPFIIRSLNQKKGGLN